MWEECGILTNLHQIYFLPTNEGIVSHNRYNCRNHIITTIPTGDNTVLHDVLYSQPIGAKHSQG